MPYSADDVEPYSVWRHVKTGSLYLALGVGTCSTNGPMENVEQSVVYVSVNSWKLRYRELSEFLDGRFHKVPKQMS